MMLESSIFQRYDGAPSVIRPNGGCAMPNPIGLYVLLVRRYQLACLELVMNASWSPLSDVVSSQLNLPSTDSLQRVEV